MRGASTCRSRRRFRRLGAAGFLLVLTVSACGSESDGGSSNPELSGEPYVIGNLMEIQTPFGTYPENYQGTVTAWETWTNDQGGINGRPVEIISIDDQADAAKSLAAARELVEEENVIAFAGIVNPSSESAYEDYLTEAGVPVVGSAFSTIADKNPNWFQTGATSYDVSGYARALAARDAGIERYGLMYCTEVPACQVDVDTQAAAAEEQLGGPEIAITLSAAISSPNFTAQCAQLADADIDGYYSSSTVEGIARAAVDCARQGLEVIHVMGESGPELLQTQEIWEHGAVGADLTVPYWADLPEADNYHAAMEAEGFDELSGASAQVWASLEVLKAALEMVPDEPATPETVKKGLYMLPDGFTPEMGVPVHYEEGQPSVVDCFYLWEIVDGEYELSHGDEPTCVE